jgi:NAD(P)-dependent dehydrogenase (short-subunit alcohol dehydrogenase family)
LKTLANKIVVITGAGSGIGRALACQAAREGATLALSDWNLPGVEETAQLAKAGKALVRKVDVRSDTDVAGFAAEVGKELGGAHAVVNNAGVSVSDTFLKMKREDFEWLFEINFWGVVRGTEAFLPQLMQQEDAHLVNISSIFGIVAVPAQTAYNAAKFAVRGFTESLRQELHGGPVHVTCVHPGGVRTNIVRSGRMVHNTHGEVADPEQTARDFDRIAKVTPEKAASIIWRGVRRNRPRVLVGGDAWIMDLLARLMPVSYPAVVRLSRKFMERQGIRL